MQDELLQNFGKTIRRLRTDRGISQERFGDMCDLHRTYVSDVELGKRNVSLENIWKMALALDTRLSDLFEEVEKDAGI